MSGTSSAKRLLGKLGKFRAPMLGIQNGAKALTGTD